MATQLPPPVDGNQNRTGEVLAMVIAAQVITSLVVSLRMFTRTFLAKCVGWDDWTIIAAWVSLPEVAYHQRGMFTYFPI